MCLSLQAHQHMKDLARKRVLEAVADQVSQPFPLEKIGYSMNVRPWPRAEPSER